jgi:hypothetical protein
LGRRAVALAGMLSMFGTAAPRAQEAAIAIRPPHAGECWVFVDLVTATAGGVLYVVADVGRDPLDGRGDIGHAPLQPTQERQVLVPLTDSIGPLRPQLRVMAYIKQGPKVTARSPVVTVPVTDVVVDQCAVPGAKPAFDRDGFTAVGTAGMQFNYFNGNSQLVAESVNPSGEPTYLAGASIPGASHPLLTFGFESETRLSDSVEGRLWLLSRVRYAALSAEVCTPDGASPIDCETAKNLPRTIVKVLENANTVDAGVGARYELHTFRLGDDAVMRPYAVGRVGFFWAADGGTKQFHTTQLALGLLMVSGDYAGSYFEAGWGESGQFYRDPAKQWMWNRLKAEGELVFKPPLARRLRSLSSMKGVIRFEVDENPGGPGADMFRTFLGTKFSPSIFYIW